MSKRRRKGDPIGEDKIVLFSFLSKSRIRDSIKKPPMSGPCMHSNNSVFSFTLSLSFSFKVYEDRKPRLLVCFANPFAPTHVSPILSRTGATFNWFSGCVHRDQKNFVVSMFIVFVFSNDFPFLHSQRQEHNHIKKSSLLQWHSHLRYRDVGLVLFSPNLRSATVQSCPTWWVSFPSSPKTTASLSSA